MEDEFATFWRIYILDNNGGGYTAITEVDMYEKLGGPDLCQPDVEGTPSAKSTHWNHDMLNAFDDVKTSNAGWLTFDVADTWIQFEFFEPKRIVQFELTVSTTLDRAPKTFWMEYSNDGVNWTKLNEFTVTDWVGLEPRKFLTGIPPISHRVTGRVVNNRGLGIEGRLIYVHSGNDHSILGTGYTDRIGMFSVDIPYTPGAMIRVVDPDQLYNTEVRENIIPVEIPSD